VWSQILVLVCAFLSLVYITVKLKNKFTAEYLMIFITLIFVFLLFLNLGDQNALYSKAENYIQIFILCSILALELIIIRSLRPVHSQFPYPFVFAPYLAFATVPFMFATTNLYMVTAVILGGGALIVSYLLLPGLMQRIESNGFLLTGILLLSVAYIFQIFRNLYTVADSWITDVPFALGMFFVSVPVSEILKHHNSKKAGN